MDFTTGRLFNNGPWLCGHRGHSIDGLENSRRALSAAKQHGAALCEIDLHLTADDRFVIFHDAVLDQASTGHGPVRGRTLEELTTLHHRPRKGGAANDPLSSLEDILDHARELGLGLVLELKDRLGEDIHFDRLIAAIDSAGMRQRILVSSFDHVVLRTLKRRHSDIATFGIIHERHVDPAAIARAGMLDAYSVDFPHLTPAAAADLTQAAVAVAHFVPNPIHFEQLGPFGETALAALADVLRSGNVAIFGCDDVAWGAAFLDGL